MPRSADLLLFDILRCIGHIEEFTAGLSFEQYQRSSLLIDAVERNFITIGEAIRRLRQVSSAVSVRIDETVQIAGFRNLLVHEYEQIDDERVWGVVKNSMPILKQQIDQWAEELGMEQPPAPAS